MLWFNVTLDIMDHCVLKASPVECRLIPLIDPWLTLDWHLIDTQLTYPDWYSVNTRPTLHQHLHRHSTDTWSACDQQSVSVNRLICIDWHSLACLQKISRLSTVFWLTCWLSIDQISIEMSIKCWSRCRLSIHQGYLIDTCRRMPLVHMMQYTLSFSFGPEHDNVL